MSVAIAALDTAEAARASASALEINRSFIYSSLLPRAGCAVGKAFLISGCAAFEGAGRDLGKAFLNIRATTPVQWQDGFAAIFGDVVWCGVGTLVTPALGSGGAGRAAIRSRWFRRKVRRDVPLLGVAERG
jgi:hypothetical protein